MNILSKYSYLLVIVPLSIAMFNLDYSIYMFLRLIAMIGLIMLAKEAHKMKKDNWFIFFISMIILINPFFKIHLNKYLWRAIDLAIIFYTISFTNKNKKNVIF